MKICPSEMRTETAESCWVEAARKKIQERAPAPITWQLWRTKDASQMLPLQSLSPRFGLFPHASQPLLQMHHDNGLQMTSYFTFSIANLPTSNAFGQENNLYLVAGTFEDQVALLNEVKGELEVQVGALAQGLQVGTEFPKGGVVHLAVERDVVLDLRAAVDAVQDVALQILVYGVVLLQAVQRDAVKRQVAGDVLSGESSFGGKLVFKLSSRRRRGSKG